MKRALSLLLSFLLIFTVVQMSNVSVSADVYGYLTYTVSNGNVTITDCDTMSSMPSYYRWNYEIPAKINGYPVTAIADLAFYGCNKLETLTIPNSVKSIGEYAFSGCSSLTAINIPSSVTKISERTFSGCIRLSSVSIPSTITVIEEAAFFNCGIKEITIPDGVTRIEEFVFNGCTSLETITIPKNVSFIGKASFYHCYNLENITVKSGNPNYFVNDGCLIETKSKTLIAGCKSGVIPQDGSIEILADSLFSGRYQLTSISIPEGITDIGEGVFRNCSALTSISIPDSVTHIGSGVFDSTAYYNDAENWENDVLYIDNHLIKANTSIDGDYTIKNGVKTIADYAFSGCTNLTSVTVSDSVVGIGKGAFYNCSNLVTVSMPKTLQNLGKSAFYNCNKLCSIEIPDGITEIGGNTFQFCYALTSAKIPNNVNNFGEYAFFGCNSLLNIEIPDGTQTIGDYAFSNSGITEITIPNSVKTMGYGAFQSCKNLTKVIISSGVNSIDGTFYNCISLTEVSIPNSVTKIGDSAFSTCTSLTELTIPSSVTYISWGAFSDCTNLTLRVVENSYAHTYAVNNSFSFVLYCPHTNTEKRNEKTATCTEEGYSGDIYCTDCEELIEKGKTIVFLDHNHKIISQTSATHIKSGEIVLECDVCGYEKTELVFALWDMDKNGLVDQTDYDLFDTETTDLTRFDINNSGDIDAFDQVVIMHLKNKTELQEIGDVNDDGTTNLKDVVRAKKIAAGYDVDGDINRNLDDKTDGNDLVFIQEFANCYLFKEW